VGDDLPGHLEVWGPEGAALVPLGTSRVFLGRKEANDVAVPWDRRASSSHAVLERYPAGWAVRDLGSTNGTTVNGEPLHGERMLRHGDELVLGVTRIVFRSVSAAEPSGTVGAPPLPELTARERDVLRALCRPVLQGKIFREPASIREIAQELVVTDATVKEHLSHLYDKFAVAPSSRRRRVDLANEAVLRGAVHRSDVATAAEPT
jgi:DNA-binding CsgD family transcriptional regulator